jgi:hypothetical protein
MRTNTSGYRGVSWHKAAQKWGAYIREGGVRHYLGLFESAEEAHEAYERVAAKLRPPIDPTQEREQLLARVRTLYDAHGVSALCTPFLEKQPENLYIKLLKTGLKQPVLLAKLGLADEYAEWRNSNRTYRGDTKLKWSWDVAVEKARQIVEKEGDVPTVEQCRKIGLSQLTNTVHKAGKRWDDLRLAIGLPPSPKFYPSRIGLRWRSRPEACLSDFLYARGIGHKKGERYPESYCKQTGRLWGQYDLHFQAANGGWIDVEIWGGMDALSGGRYRRTRAEKEAWQAQRPNFLGIDYLDCLSDARLTEILKPYVGVIEPFVFDKSADHYIETSHWSDADELLVTCKQLAAERPDGVFPSESWLRKRGKHKGRPGEPYNSLSQYVNRWLGGTRNVRRLLGQGEANTIKWTPESVIQAWHDFESKHGLSPSQCEGTERKKTLSPEIVNEARRIYQAASRMGVRDEARNGRTARKTKWTPEYTLSQWRSFMQRNGRTPSECMSKMRRRTMPRAVTDEATRIYDAASRLGILGQCRVLECAGHHPRREASDGASA